jgi:hypothetical protein
VSPLLGSLQEFVLRVFLTEGQTEDLKEGACIYCSHHLNKLRLKHFLKHRDADFWPCVGIEGTFGKLFAFYEKFCSPDQLKS